MKLSDKDISDIGENRGLRVSCGKAGTKSFFTEWTVTLNFFSWSWGVHTDIEGTYDFHKYENECKVWLQKWVNYIDVCMSIVIYSDNQGSYKQLSFLIAYSFLDVL